MTALSPLDNEIHPRRPLVAALMSLALPGLGQLYDGELDKGLWLFIAFAFVGAPGTALAALYAPAPLMLPLLAASAAATLGVWIYSIVDAWRLARRRQAYAPRAWQASGLYALLFLAGNVSLYAGLASQLRAHFVEPFFIPSASMAPTLLPGDMLFADKRYNCPSCKSRAKIGDVGIFVYPNDRSFYYIKRIVGLPGDQVAIHGRDVAVNGKSLTETQLVEGDHVVVTERFGDHAWRVQWPANDAGGEAEFTVPPGEIFVLGDDRGLSVDSRKFGPVPLADLVAKARQIWFSWSGGVRWSRLGESVD